jgi:hypothetical protein
MVQLILNDDQARVIRESVEPVEIVDRTGNRIGILKRGHQWTPEELAEAERRARSDGPWYSTQEVLDHLNSLERT